MMRMPENHGPTMKRSIKKVRVVHKPSLNKGDLTKYPYLGVELEECT